MQYVNKSIQEKYIQQVFDAVLCSPEIENIQPKLGSFLLYICRTKIPWKLIRHWLHWSQMWLVWWLVMFVFNIKCRQCVFQKTLAVLWFGKRTWNTTIKELVSRSFWCLNIYILRNISVKGWTHWLSIVHTVISVKLKM